MDVGTVGPDGTVYYARTGTKPDRIRVTACPDNVVLSTNANLAEKQCTDYARSLKGVYELTDKRFKEILEDTIRKGEVMSGAAVEQSRVLDGSGSNFSSSGYRKAQARIEELNQINKFIKAYGAANANMARKAELESYLTADKMQAYNFIQREIQQQLSSVPGFIDKIKGSNVNLILNSQNPLEVKFLNAVHSYCDKDYNVVYSEELFGRERYASKCLYMDNTHF